MEHTLVYQKSIISSTPLPLHPYYIKWLLPRLSFGAWRRRSTVGWPLLLLLGQKKKKQNKTIKRMVGSSIGMGLLCALSMGVEDWVLWELGKNERLWSLTRYTTWNVLKKENVGWLVGWLFVCLLASP